MAISKEKWQLAKEYFEIGKSLSYIVNETGVSKSQISKKSKAEMWQKEGKKKQLVDDAVRVAVEKETLNETALEIHEKEVDLQTRRANLVYNASELILKKATEFANKGKAQKVVSSKMGTDVIETDLQSNDYKNLADTIDKASITLGVNERFSSSQVQVNNQQNSVPVINISIDE